MKNRQEREKKVVELMIRLYCKGNHQNVETGVVRIKGQLCDECAEMLAYAQRHVEHCRYGAEKTFCAHCPKSCYKQAMRERIRAAMRYSGPRMMLHHPIVAVRHLIESHVDKKR